MVLILGSDSFFNFFDFLTVKSVYLVLPYFVLTEFIFHEGVEITQILIQGQTCLDLF